MVCCMRYANFLSVINEESVTVSTFAFAHVSGKQGKIKKTLSPHETHQLLGPLRQPQVVEYLRERKGLMFSMVTR